MILTELEFQFLNAEKFDRDFGDGNPDLLLSDLEEMMGDYYTAARYIGVAFPKVQWRRRLAWSL